MGSSSSPCMEGSVAVSQSLSLHSLKGGKEQRPQGKNLHFYNWLGAVAGFLQFSIAFEWIDDSGEALEVNAESAKGELGGLPLTRWAGW